MNIALRLSCWLGVALLSACSPADAPLPAAKASVIEAAASPVPSRLAPLITVHKSPSCGCCHVWVERMEAAGFRVKVHDRDDLDAVKQSLGVPPRMASCHTAEVEGYVLEGHVPAEDIQRLLTQKPDVRGLAVPGMPRGSPGMEMPDGTRDAYSVIAIGRDGSLSEYARH